MIHTQIARREWRPEMWTDKEDTYTFLLLTVGGMNLTTVVNAFVNWPHGSFSTGLDLISSNARLVSLGLSTFNQFFTNCQVIVCRLYVSSSSLLRLLRMSSPARTRHEKNTMPDKVSDRMQDKMWECVAGGMSECQIVWQITCQIERQNIICQIECRITWQRMCPGRISEYMSDKMPERIYVRYCRMSNKLAEYITEIMSVEWGPLEGSNRLFLVGIC